VIYNVSFKIPNIIQMQNSDITSWFQMDKGEIRQVYEDETDLYLIKQYYLEYLRSIKSSGDYAKCKEELFQVLLDDKGQKGMRKVSKKQMLQVFSSYLDNQSFTNTWVKVMDCFPQQVESVKQTQGHCSYFDVVYGKKPGEKPSTQIFIKKIEVQPLSDKDIQKVEDDDFKPKVLPPHRTEPIKSRSAWINEKLEQLVSGIVGFLETKVGTVPPL
jgi:hypothetical protein